MSTYDEDVNDEFNAFEDTVGADELSLGDYIEWLEAVIDIAQMRLEGARLELGV